MTTTSQPKLGEILVRAGVIDNYQLEAALGEQGNWGHRVGVTLVKLGFLSERDLVRALAHQLELPIAGLEGKRIHPDVLGLVPQEVAQKTMVLPLFIRDENAGKVLYVAMDDPCDFEAVDEISQSTGFRVKPVVVAPSELAEGIERYYRELEETSSGIMPAAPEPQSPEPQSPEPQSLEPQSPAAPEEAQSAAADAVAEPAMPEAQESAPSFDPSPAAARLAPFEDGAEDELEVDDEEASDLQEPEPMIDAEPAPVLEDPEPLEAKAPAEPQPASAAPPAQDDPELLNRRVTRALAQLLVEKGLLGRDELQERLTLLARAERAEKS